MIECHPLLRPVVQLAKPVVHAIRHWRPHRHVAHHIHRATTAVTPSPAVMTVCQRVAGPLVAGGLVLLPPASAVPPAGGVGGFPGAFVPEYGAPAFGGPGYIGPGGYAGGPTGFGGYGPGGFAGLGGGIIGPAVSSPGASSPGVISPIPGPTTIAALNTPTGPEIAPILSTTSPGASTPGTSNPGTTTPGGTTPGGSTPGGTTPGDGTTPGGTTPGGGTTAGGTTPGGTTPGGTTPGGTTPGGETPPVSTPEPGTIALLGGLFVAAVFARSRLRRRG